MDGWTIVVAIASVAGWLCELGALVVAGEEWVGYQIMSWPSRAVVSDGSEESVEKDGCLFSIHIHIHLETNTISDVPSLSVSLEASVVKG